MIIEEESYGSVPLYQCHKKVRALEIQRIQNHTYFDDGGSYQDGAWLTLLTPKGTVHGERKVSQSYIEKHRPETGGYWVLYEDGYESFSPAKAFEDGYTLIGA